jgi:hypothetical protein
MFGENNQDGEASPGKLRINHSRRARFGPKNEKRAGVARCRCRFASGYFFCGAGVGAGVGAGAGAGVVCVFPVVVVVVGVVFGACVPSC